MLSRSRSKSKNRTNHLKQTQQQPSSFSSCGGTSVGEINSSSSSITFSFSGTEVSFFESFIDSSFGTNNCDARRDVKRNAFIKFWLCFRHGVKIDDLRRSLLGAVVAGGSLNISKDEPKWTDGTDPDSNHRNGFPI